MTLTKDMSRSVWNSQEYYQEAGKASELDHPSLKLLASRYRDDKILEVGCGEGTKLSKLKAKYRAGVDVSSIAVGQAKTKLDFAAVVDGTKLPFDDQEFDAALSFFSLEHFEHPERVLAEMKRVTKVGGELALLTPNFGAPNRSSPCYKGSRLSKLMRGIFSDLFNTSSGELNWQHVTPLTEKFAYQSDYDTVVEPYIRTLIKYLVKHNFEIISFDSNWNIQFNNESILQKFFKYLGKNGLYPFYYWGPHCFVIAKRVK